VSGPGTLLPDRVWRVGYHADPLGFVPFERTTYSQRFDDAHERFRSLYCARNSRTALREVLADLRRNAEAVARFAAAHGPEAARELPDAPVAAASGASTSSRRRSSRPTARCWTCATRPG
jgi:RES domain